MKRYNIITISLLILTCIKPSPVGRTQDSTKSIADTSKKDSTQYYKTQIAKFKNGGDSLNIVKQDLFKQLSKKKLKQVIKTKPIFIPILKPIYVPTVKKDTVIIRDTVYLPMESTKPKKGLLYKIFH